MCAKNSARLIKCIHQGGDWHEGKVGLQGKKIV